MKKHIGAHKYILAALLLLTTTSMLANNDPDVEKKKTYTKTYSVSGSDKVNINNQFGEVKITTWTRNEVKLDVTIVVKAGSEEAAQDIIDNITIEDSKGSDGVTFKTNMDHKDTRNNKKRGQNSQSMEVNYEVSMPAGNPLDLMNQFGKTFVPDMTGPVSITQKFGDLVAGNLPNTKELHVEFGSAVVESIGNGKVEIKFSKAEIKKMNGSIKGNFEYCDKVKLSLTNSVSDFSLNQQFSTIDVTISEGFSGDFDIHTNFGEFRNSSAIAIKEEKEDDEHGPKFDKDYSGKSGSGACKVKVKSSFGTIRFI